MTSSTRKILIIGLIAILVSASYMLFSFSRQNKSLSNRQDDALVRLDELDIETETTNKLGTKKSSLIKTGNLLLVNNVPGDDYGKLIILDNKLRTQIDETCVRVHASKGKALCLAKSGYGGHRNILYNIEKSNPEVIGSWSGFNPSRARVSPDGKWASTTMFISGNNYQDIGEFKTYVEMIPTADYKNRFTLDEKSLEQFEMSKEDKKTFLDPDGNFWGTTFGQDGEFYITFGNKKENRIVKGSLKNKTIEITNIVGSCPSLSPDGKTLIYKKLVDNSYRLTALDLTKSNEQSLKKSNKLTLDSFTLGETKSVEDQNEWLNDNTIIYALHTGDKPDDLQPEFDIWSLEVKQDSKPKLYTPLASSPAAYRN